MRRRTSAAAGVVASAAVAASWEVARRRTLRAIERDPEHERLQRPLDGAVHTVTSRDGTSLHVRTFGPDSAPPVVLIHGWTCALRFWTNQIHALAGPYRVIAYDLRGHGASERPAGMDFSTDALAADLQAVLGAMIPDGRRALLAGHSLGAMAIAAWAGSDPGRVSERAAGAALLNTGLGDLVSESLIVRVPTRLGRTRAAIGGAVLGTRAPMPPASPITYRLLRYATVGPSASPAQVAFCHSLVRDSRRDVRAACGRTITRLDLRDAVGSLTVPTAVVAGGRDRLTPPAHAERLAGELPDLVELVRLPEAGHLGPIEAPDEVNALLDRLARRVLAGADRPVAADPAR